MSNEFPIRDEIFEKKLLDHVTIHVTLIDDKINVLLNQHMKKFSEDYVEHGSLKNDDRKRFQALVDMQTQKLYEEALKFGKEFNEPHFQIIAKKSLWQLRLIFYRGLDVEISTEFSLMFKRFVYVLQKQFDHVTKDYLRELCFHLRNDIDMEPYNDISGNKGERLFIRYTSGTATVVEKMHCIKVMEHLVEKINMQHALTNIQQSTVWRQWKKEKTIAFDKLRYNHKEEERVEEYTGESSLITPNGNTPYSCPVRLRSRSATVAHTTEDGSLGDPYLEYLRCGFYENLISSAAGCWNNHQTNAPYDLHQVSLTFENPEYTEATVLESVAYLESLNR